jgi:hypothetical protein
VGYLFTNNAVGVLAGSYSASATAITMGAGQGALFPSPGLGEWFAATIVDVSNNKEIVLCTGRTADTLTVMRGQEGTAARALAAGERIEHRLTAAALISLRDGAIDGSRLVDGSITGAKLATQTITANKLAANSVGTFQLAEGAVTAPKLASGAAALNLGFTPVQQGGGPGMTGERIILGWTAQGKISAYIEGFNYGFLLAEQNNGTVGSAGRRGIPINVQNNDYVLGLTDAGGAILHSDATNRIYYLPDVSVPFENGSWVKIINRSAFVTLIPMGGMSLIYTPSGLTGARIMGAPDQCIVERVDETTWWVHGGALA